MPKSKQSPKLFFSVFVLVYHSKALFPLEKACVWTAKGQYCFGSCNVFGEKMPLARPQQAFLYFTCAWTTKNNITSDHVIY